MTKINFGTYTQYSFWGNVDYPSNKDALKARNSLATSLKAQGLKVVCHTLSGQCRKYSGLGQPDGTLGNVYKLDVLNTTIGLTEDSNAKL